MEKLAGRITNIVLLGFFSMLCSLPIVTAGASFTALNKATKAYLYENEDKPLRTFFNTFKDKFKLSTLVWLLHLVFIAVLVWDFVYYRTGDDTISILASAGIFVLLMFVLFEVSLVFVIIGEDMADDIPKAMKTALDVAMDSFWQCLMIIVLYAAVILTSLFLFRGLIFFAPGLMAFLAWQILPEMLKRYKYRKKRP